MRRKKYPKPRRPKYRLHRASGRGVIQYRPLYGENPKYLPGEYGSEESLAEYERCCADILAHQLRNIEPPARPRQGTVADLLLNYLVWAETYYGGSPRSELANMKAAAKTLNKTCGRVKLAEFGPSHLKACRAAMVDKLARTTINSRVQRMRRIFRWGVEHEMVDASIVVRLEMVAPLREGRTEARETAPVRPVSQEAIDAVLPFVAPVVRDMVSVQLLTGMRSGELVRMTAAEIDRSGSVWLYRPAKHKTRWRGKSKVIAIGPRAQKILKPYLERKGFFFSPADAARWHYIQAEAPKPSRTLPMYPSEVRQREARKAHRRQNPRIRAGKRYTPNTYANALNYGFRRLAKSLGYVARPPQTPLREWLESVGVSYWHPHQLRHTRSTATRAVYGLEGAQAQLGNTPEATERYAEKSVELAKTIARQTG